MSGAPFVPADLIDLLLMHLARVKRRKLSGADASDFYEEFFSEVDVSVLGDDADRRKQVRLSGVRDAVVEHVRPGARVLDVGCGCGDNLRSLAELDGLSLYGLDFAQANVDRTKALLGDRVSVSRGSAYQLPFPDEHFEAVTCIEVLEHLADDGGALEEIRRVLVPGSVLVLTVPHRHWFPSYRSLIGHERHYDRRTLVELLRRHGFSVERYIPNFPRWHRAADYSYVFVRILALVSARLGGQSAPHRIRLPGMNRTLLELINGWISPIYESDARLDYPSIDSSTSIVARRN